MNNDKAPERVEEHIKRVMHQLRTPSWFSSPEEVDKFFRESLVQMARVTIMDIAEEEGWEESEQYYLSKIAGLEKGE